VRLTDGTVQCCRGDGRGRLGTSTVGLFSAFFTPATGFMGHAVHVAAGDGAVCALVQGGTVECWGSNAHGELGGSKVDSFPIPRRRRSRSEIMNMQTERE
jgi:alpha-tubulin suppressor-like RCC1 family protein